jgi:hypothetical protein
VFFLRWEEHKRSMEPDLLTLTVQDDERRLESFLGNAKLADARNSQETDPVHGLTKFSSLTQGRHKREQCLRASLRKAASFLKPGTLF